MKAAVVPASAKGAKPRCEVATCVLEYLCTEAVAYTLRTTPSAEVAAARLELLGLQIGKRLAERLTRDKGRFATDVEAVRFVCKEFWQEMAGHTANGLHRNKSNKGLFQVEDAHMRFLLHVSAAADSTTLKDDAQRFVMLPCGMVRGALECLGFDATVKCIIGVLPACSFVITIKET